MSLNISTPQVEGVLQVSKARKLPILISFEEMRRLFDFLGSFFIFDVSRPLELENGEIPKQLFLEKYHEYVEGIRQGKLIDESILRSLFSSVITSTAQALYAMPLSNGKYLVKPKIPVIQLQRHHFIFSESFHSGVISGESVTWGVQFSYPQLFLDPKTQEIGKVEKNEKFPNTELFHQMAKWVRDHTAPTPFIFEGRQINQPMRLGKECFGWINHHPSLQSKGLHVAARKNPQGSH